MYRRSLCRSDRQLAELAATIVGVAIWSVSLGIFRLMAKIDPYLVRVYLRHLKYQNYYCPRSTPWREE